MTKAKRRRIKEKSKSKTIISDEVQEISCSSAIKVPEKIIDQVIGQDHAVDVIKKAARQRRHVLLIGPSGTGKSMLAQGMSELLPAEDLEDVLAYPNPLDENTPKIRVVQTYPKNADRKKEIGQGRKILYESKARKAGNGGSKALIAIFVFLIISLLAINFFQGIQIDLEKHANLIGAAILGILIFASMWLFTSRIRMPSREDNTEPKLLIDNTGITKAPFLEATGAKAGALFGDCLHDPLQSGGLGTPAHLRLEAGAIHKANKGVLYIDEIGSLSPKSQQDLLTAMQEKKFPITGQSEMSSGAMVRSEPVPCDFILVAAGNVHDLQAIHPALRSRIRGYGYEVYLNDSMPDTPENRLKLARFVAQEVKKDGKIPHFASDAIAEIINEARRRSGRKKRLTLKLRDLGGLVRAAGDIAKEQGAVLVTAEHVRAAKRAAQTIEQQIATQLIDVKKEYAVLVQTGAQVGRVNGLALIGDSGLVMPIVAEVTPASSRFEGKVIATGKLGEIAKEAVANVSAVIKKYMKKDVASYDIHIQFLQTYEGVEGDSASISVALAVLSAMEGIPIRQDVAATGSLSVRGEVLPVSGVTQKAEAALEAGIKTIIVPEKNIEDIVLPEERRRALRIIPARTIIDVLAAALIDCERKSKLIAELRKKLK